MFHFTIILWIWKVNLKRIKALKPELRFDEADILDWVEDSWNSVEDDKRNPWNGRQIHNAVRTAAALASFKAENNNRLTPRHFRKVEKASREFDRYLENTRGQDDLSIAHTMQDRADPRKADMYQDKPITPKLPRSRPSNDGHDRLPAGLELSSAGRRVSTPQQPARQIRNSKKEMLSDDEVDEELSIYRRQRRTNGGAKREEDGLVSDDE